MECNTVTFTASDGMELPLPLGLLIEKGAVVASRVNGEDVLSVMGAVNQLWVPGLPAKYYIRDISEIRFSKETEPAVLDSFEDDGTDFVNRPNVSVQADFTGIVGVPLSFEGYAADYDRAICAVQFSLDQGLHWTSYPIDNASPDKWVYWHFDYTPTAPGSYQLKVRSVNEDGKISPVSAVHVFEVLPE